MTKSERAKALDLQSVINKTWDAAVATPQKRGDMLDCLLFAKEIVDELLEEKS